MGSRSERRASDRGARQPTLPSARLGDVGQTTPLAALLLALVAGSLVLLGQLGGLLADRARARTAADAAALAGAAEGDAAARAVAGANGATVETVFRDGDDVEVTVRSGAARATARARRSWVIASAGPAG